MTENRVHILLHGRPLCGFMPDRFPGEWPEGEVWIGFDQDPERAVPEVNRCADCFEAYKVPRERWRELWPEVKRWRADAGTVLIELSRSEADTLAAVIVEIRCGTLPRLPDIPRETVAELDRVHFCLVRALHPELSAHEARKRARNATSDVVAGARQKGRPLLDIDFGPHERRALEACDIDPEAYALNERQRIAIAQANEAIAVMGDRIAEGAKRYLEGVERAAADLSHAIGEWYDRHINATTWKPPEMPLDVHIALGPEQIDEALAADPDAPRVTAEVIAPPCYCPDPVLVGGEGEAKTCKQCGRRYYPVCMCPEPELVKVDWERGEQGCSICGKPYDETLRPRLNNLTTRET